jgi:hypothetical protein
MKKLLLILFVFLLLIVAGIYIFIPSKIEFAKITYIHAARNVTTRYIADESNWIKWWPSDSSRVLSSKQNKNLSYIYKNYNYTITRKALEGTSILIMYDGKEVNTFLHLIAVKPDSVVAEWKGELEGTNNPVTRIKNYLLAIEVKKNISEVLQNAKTFLENTEGVYGMSIIQQQVKDTLLISTKITSDNYPSTAEIYNLITRLREYIFLNGATETNSPMLNITKDSIYKITVAIPINHVIPPTEKFLLKKMVPGKILVAEVKGGTYTADEGLKQLTLYMDDNHLVSPAIPFQSLVTERIKVTDTTKWITKIYFPVF